MRQTPVSCFARGAGPSLGGTVLPPPGVGLLCEPCRPGALIPRLSFWEALAGCREGRCVECDPPPPKAESVLKVRPAAFPSVARWTLWLTVKHLGSVNIMLLYYELVVEDAGIPTKLGLNYSFPELALLWPAETGWFHDNGFIFLPLTFFFFW